MRIPIPAPRPPSPRVGILIAAGTLALLLLFGLLAAIGTSNRARSGHSAYSRGERSIDLKSIHLSAPTPVVIGKGSSATPKLLVMVTNDGKLPLDDVSVQAKFWSGQQEIGNARESTSGYDLMPGESHPLLFTLPNPAGDRHSAAVLEAEPVDADSEGAVLECVDARLVQQAAQLRFACRVHNDRDVALHDVRSVVLAYDQAGAPVAVASTSVQSEIAPRADAFLDADLQVLRAAPVATWTYRLSYDLADAKGNRHATSKNRTVRGAAVPETWREGLRVESEDLLANGDERLDPKQLRLEPLVQAFDQTHDPVYLTEIVNTSSSVVALSVGALVTPFDGAKAGRVESVDVPALYPGERLPIRLHTSELDRVTRTDVAWKPMRRGAVPGQRPALTVEVQSKTATTGSVLVNFTRRYSYKAVVVKGTVTNSSKSIVQKPRLWVMLRDGNGKLSGFGEASGLSTLAPGASLPFEARVEQQGSAFADVTTLYSVGK